LLGYEEETIVNGLSVAAKVVYSCALTFYYWQSTQLTFVQNKTWQCYTTFNWRFDKGSEEIWLNYSIWKIVERLPFGDYNKVKTMLILKNRTICTRFWLISDCISQDEK
jgi:hypothetical protein